MLTPHKIRERILKYEEEYPEFKTALGQNDIAMIYGWGHAITAYENYVNLKSLLVAP